jgi:hypothetical protein
MSSTVMLGLIGSIVTLALLFEMLRRRQLREKYAVFWAVVAVATLLVAVFPELLARAASALGVAVPSNLLFFVASMVLFVISVQHSSELGKLEDHNRTLAEELALVKVRLESLESGKHKDDEPGATVPGQEVEPDRTSG